MFSRDFTVIRNLIDYSRFAYSQEIREETRAELGISSGAVVIGHVGDFFVWKNQTFLLDVFNKFQAQVPDSYLVLVGGGDDQLRSSVTNLVSSLGLVGQVIFLEPRASVQDLYQCFDLFAFPSLFEGVPLALLEAQVCGLPSVFSHVIDSEAVISDFALPVDLQEGPEQWSKTLLELMRLDFGHNKRLNRCLSVSNSHDSRAHGQDLEKFYLLTNS